jgi:hypothetical protein
MQQHAMLESRRSDSNSFCGLNAGTDSRCRAVDGMAGHGMSLGS